MAVHKYDGLNTKLLFKVFEICKGFSIWQTNLTAVDYTFSPFFYFYSFLTQVLRSHLCLHFSYLATSWVQVHTCINDVYSNLESCQKILDQANKNVHSIHSWTNKLSGKRCTIFFFYRLSKAVARSWMFDGDNGQTFRKLLGFLCQHNQQALKHFELKSTAHH